MWNGWRGLSVGIVAWGLVGCAATGGPEPRPSPSREPLPARPYWNYGFDSDHPVPGEVTVGFGREHQVRIQADGRRLSAPDRRLEAAINRILEEYDVRSVHGGDRSMTPVAFWLEFAPETDTRSIVKAFQAIWEVEYAYRTPRITPAASSRP